MPNREGDWEHYPRKFGKYHLLAPLAQGGMGALYLAVAGDRGLERMMVIKTVLPHLADAEYVARFRDEAKVVVKLSHGNLIPVFDAGLVGGELFLAMDFVEGRDLRAVWNRCAKKQVAFPIDVAVYIVKELCRGLAYAHAFPDLNLVHRDISPPNVLVSYTGEVKLTDFGLASSTLKLEKTAPGIIYGKVAYMSPEQARGEKLDGRSDMYATGIVLWELLTGRQLFPPGKDQPQDLLSRAKNPEVMRPSKRAPRVPVELDEICLKALAPAKEDRYADCDEMRMALQSWLATNAPTTDGTRMSVFLQELFSEDIVRERAERAEMISRVRTRALTLPPTDELRQMIEKSDKVSIADLGTDEEGAPVRKPGSVGRRATDRGDDGNDRRRESDRRLQSQPKNGGGKANESGALALAAEEEEAPELGIGSIIDGRYKVTELIGEGGMGKVYLAEHVEIGKRVALKVLHPSYSRMPDLVERFRREARAASKIGHPNIVDVTDSGSTPDGSVYFVMEYLEGVELGSAIEREGALDIARALRITTQICRALSAAHREGIIHRDLKPENIYLITRGGEADVVKVLDFGIAKTTEAEAARERRLTSPGMAMGTPEYMAPEQAAGRPADARTDVYSLGAIMYEMVTGVPPYQGDNFMEILTKKATLDPPPPNTIRSELPAPVSDLVLAAMSRNPDTRPQSMDALEYELNKCLSGRGQAVASILGMTTDANIVATLNPGLSTRNLDSGIVNQPSVRATTSGHADMWETRSGVSRSMYNSGPVVAHSPTPSGSVRLPTDPGLNVTPASSGSMARAGSPNQFARPATPVPPERPSMPSQPYVDPAAEPVQLKRSGMAVFGWVMLILILVAGGGALAYVMLFQNKKEPTIPAKADESLQPGSDALGSAKADKPDKNDKIEKSPKTPKNKVNGADKTETPKGSGAVATEPDKTPDAGSANTTKTAPTGKKTTKVAADDKMTVPQLQEAAKKAETSGDWDSMMIVWQKLEKAKTYKFPGYAVYKQAWAAFQNNDTANAQQLAQKASTMPGNQKLDAKELYADALFKQGDFQRAKDFYIGLRKQVPTDARKAGLAKKIVRCNEKLKKPERDGITN
ncbi:MAG TPA: protein kinase [Kofleriaceae bacterium]|nr:protein kinase [Kofleriaceae bacterium]